MKYSKYSMPKHERDRLFIEEHKRLVRSTIFDAPRVTSEEDHALVFTVLGNGSYWKRQLKAPY